MHQNLIFFGDECTVFLRDRIVHVLGRVLQLAIIVATFAMSEKIATALPGFRQFHYVTRVTS